MEQKTIVTNHKSIGLASILTIIFVIAKLLGKIQWSWIIVFLPVIISVGIGILILIITIILTAIIEKKG
jgi:hypothetical protein